MGNCLEGMQNKEIVYMEKTTEKMLLTKEK